MEGKMPRVGPSELQSGVSKGLNNGQQRDKDPYQRSSKVSANTPEISQESGGRTSHHGRSFSYERNKAANGSMGTVKEGLKNGVEGQSPNSVNQNGGLYIGGGKVAVPTGGSHGPITSNSGANGRGEAAESSPHVVHVRSNSAGSIRTGKSSGSANWSPGNSNAFEGGLNGGGRGKGENGMEVMSSSGSSSGGSPAQELGKGNKVHHESSSGGTKARGLGNISGRGGSVNPKSPTSGQATNRGGLSTPRNSGEFSIPINGNVMFNRGSSTPRHSGEFTVGGTGPGSSSSTSSPHTSGELGNAKANSNSISKSSPDSSISNSRGGSVRVSSVEGNTSGRINTGLNAVKGGKSMPGSPPRSTPASIPNMGNLRKANWMAGRTKSNEKIDCTMGNILNPNHTPPCTNGNIMSSAYNGKGVGKNDATKNGVDVANADPLSDSALLKKGFSSCNSEEVKNIGNDFYRKGSFADALSLYERAINLSPGQASYRSNKAAALSGLGRLPEAVHECEEAIKLDSRYDRAHQRAATLYLRLGLVESSKRHYQSLGQQGADQERQQVEQVKMHISKCIEMRKVGNWKLVIKESDAAIAAGADSAPQVFGYKAEALLKLRKPEEADIILSKAQKFDEALTKFGITTADSFLHVVRAHLDMALGRFEEAVTAAQSAVRVDPRKTEALDTLRRARAVSLARKSGNELFKTGKFFEACAAYGEGLESDPTNGVLLCNRAACRSKIGQWEKAVEDCNAALDVQPNYTKALMRRADSNAKLERWEDALNDYEQLLKEIPGDQDLAHGVFEAQAALQKSRSEEMYKRKFGNEIEEVSNKDQLREAVTLPGLVVVQFLARWNDRCREILPFMEVLCKRYPAVNFIKIDVEENPYLAKMESVNSVPTFKLYKNGTKMKEMLGPSQQALEYAVQQYSL